MQLTCIWPCWVLKLKLMSLEGKKWGGNHKATNYNANIIYKLIQHCTTLLYNDNNMLSTTHRHACDQVLRT